MKYLFKISENNMLTFRTLRVLYRSPFALHGLKNTDFFPIHSSKLTEINPGKVSNYRPIFNEIVEKVQNFEVNMWNFHTFIVFHQMNSKNVLSHISDCLVGSEN